MNMLTDIPGRIRERFQLMRYRRHIRDLISRGLEIGKNVTIMPTVWIDHEYCYLISIGDNCSLSKGVRLIAHDATTFKFTGGFTKIGRIKIGENCFLGENCIILPGVTIGSNVLVTAGSVVNKDIASNSCVAGNPARFYAKFDEFIGYHKRTVEDIHTRIVEYSDLGIGPAMKKSVKDSIASGDVYVHGYSGKFPWTWNEG